jgi:hypothetical protein
MNPDDESPNLVNHFNIGLLDGHYFLNETVECTQYAIENYANVSHMKNWNQIYRYVPSKKCYYRDAKRYTTSFKLLQTMIRITVSHRYSNIVNKICDKYQVAFAANRILEYISNDLPVLTPIRFDNSDILSSPYYKKVETTIEHLRYSYKSCLKEVEYKEPRDLDPTEPHEILTFDFETISQDRHTPYVLCSYNARRGLNTYYGEDAGKQLLDSIDCNTILLAHNSSYDYRFIVRYLKKNKELSRGNSLIVSKSVYNDNSIIIKDSMKLISGPLSGFSKIFNLPIKKDIMPYKLYTHENVAQRFIEVETALKIVEEYNHEQFLNNLEEWNLKQGTTYDIIEYSRQYCMLDCQVLYQGYFIFRGWILDQFGLDVNHILTAASLADTFLKKTGCYDDVYLLSGVPQVFIQKCIVGGRVMSSQNKKHIIREEENQIINDFDAVSLYPSAMYRMPGFLKGKPCVIKNLSYDVVQYYDGYFVEIEITNIGIKRSFPLVSFKTDKGIRKFTNDCIGQHIFVDKPTLEDLIKFQHLEFNIIRGYYFNEGFNTKIKEIIKFMFEERLKLKKQGNPAEMVYKLMMNSSYGKTIMKPVEHTTHIFNTKKKCDSYLSKNYNQIYEVVQFGPTHYKVWTYKSILKHFNCAHIGCMILSYSKRIMNEVMCLGEDHGLKIFYQDTDSMHISDKDISVLSKEYQLKYRRELIGKGMGQFHSDFSLKGCTDVVSVACVFNGKKCYIDKLRGKNKNGELEYGYHIRMKGVPTDVVVQTANKLNVTPFELFEKLYHGEAIEFDLLDNGTKNGKPRFEFTKNYEIHSKTSFVRKLKF